jgi:hypothetical protein
MSAGCAAVKINSGDCTVSMEMVGVETIALTDVEVTKIVGCVRTQADKVRMIVPMMNTGGKARRN